MPGGRRSLRVQNSRNVPAGQFSNRDPLQVFRVIFFCRAIVEARGAWVGMASQVLDVFEWNTLLEQIGNGRHPEGVRRQARGKGSVAVLTTLPRGTSPVRPYNYW